MILNHEIRFVYLVIDTKNPLIGTFFLLVCSLVEAENGGELIARIILVTSLIALLSLWRQMIEKMWSEGNN